MLGFMRKATKSTRPTLERREPTVTKIRVSKPGGRHYLVTDPKTGKSGVFFATNADAAKYVALEYWDLPIWRAYSGDVQRMRIAGDLIERPAPPVSCDHIGLRATLSQQIIINAAVAYDRLTVVAV